MDTNNIAIQKIILENNFPIDVLRLDTIHPQISGNKYFKLIYNIQYAIDHNYNTFLSLGGAHSNHLHALAYMCFEQKINCIGLVRGNAIQTPTLDDCKKWGMQIHFIAYDKWRLNNEDALETYIQENFQSAYYIPLGGENRLGVKGFDLLKKYFINYDYIYTAVGTGTTLAGITNNILPHQKVFGVQAVKDITIHFQIQKFTPHQNFLLLDNYTFGGFAKYNQTLIDFIKLHQNKNNLTLDFVYNAKCLYGLQQEILIHPKLYDNKKILMLHTGGLQGKNVIE